MNLNQLKNNNRASGAEYKRWVWTELLGFDSTQDDGGVRDYLDTLGFVPQGISLLLSAPDFILQHHGLEENAILPPDFCARNGHNGNEIRARQEWTQLQLKKLVDGLKEAGCAVYFSCFTAYLENKFHHEWLSDHPEGKTVSAPEGKRGALFVLARLADGSYLQDYFAEQVAKVCLDYGFDGWHGPDGFGPQWGIQKFGCSDDFVAQFQERGHDLPESILAPCEDQPELLTQRMDWIWRHRRLEWMEFYSDRWAEFWKTMSDALHTIGRKTMINSAWTRDPFEAKYRYGIDYRKIAAAGVDSMMVETAAGGILLGSDDRDYHSDYLMMLMLIRACVPNMELIFLHNIKDVIEDWDLLRHDPPMLEREVYSLANVYYRNAAGEIERCVDGFMGCLADGIIADEWEWLFERWDLAFETLPKKVLGATLLWSDSMLDEQIKNFPTDRNATVHYLAFKLLEHNAPVQLVARLENLEKADGPFLILNPHLLSQVEKSTALNSGKELILIGPDFTGWPEPAFEYSDNGSGIRLYGLKFESALPKIKSEESVATATVPADPWSIEEPLPFRAELLVHPVSPDFFKTCAHIIQKVTNTYAVEYKHPANLVTPPPLKIGIMMTELEDGTIRVAVKNRATIYGRPIVDLKRDIESVKVRSSFPVTKIKTEDSKCHLVVPQRGIVVMDVTIKS